MDRAEASGASDTGSTPVRGTFSVDATHPPPFKVVDKRDLTISFWQNIIEPEGVRDVIL